MKTLILMRHAKSGWGNPDLKDRDRPLNKRGERASPQMGAWIKAQDLVPDLALVSDARRTRETWDLLGLECPVSFHAGLYLAEPEEILTHLAQQTAERVLVLCHNPGVAELAATLASDWPKHERFMQFPTASVCVLTLNQPDWQGITPASAAVQHFVTPHDL